MFEHLVWLVPLAVAGVGSWRPRAGLAVLAAALPFFGSPPGGPYLGAFDAAALAAIATCWRAGRPAATPLAWPALAFVAVGLASLLPLAWLPPSWAPSILLRLAAALPGVEGWSGVYTWRAGLDLLIGWGLFVSVRRAFAGRSLQPLALGLLAGLGAVVLLGLGAESGLVDLDAYRPRYPSKGLGPRLASVFFLSGWLSQYLVVATPLALSGVAARLGRWRHLMPVALALALACLALTRQRGAWLAAGVQLAAAAALLVPRWRRQGRLAAQARRVAAAGVVVLAIAGAIVLATGDVGDVVDRAASIRSAPTPRLPLWRGATEMFRQRPLAGWGIGAFAPAFDVLHPPGSPGALDKRGSAHNLYLQTAAETGLLGLAALALLGWAAALALRRPRAGHGSAALALAVALVGVAAYGVVQHMLYLRAVAWLIWLLLGGVAVAAGDGAGGRPARLARILAAVALALIPVRLVAVDPPPLAGSRSFGFHETEGNQQGRYRWTEGFAATRLAAPTGSLSLAFANGHPLGGRRPVTVVVGLDGERMGKFEVPGGWQSHTFELPAGGGRETVLTLAARPTFRPFSDYLAHPELRPSRDIRSLGIAVRLPEDLAAQPP